MDSKIKLILLAGVAVSFTGPAGAEDSWNQWRGPLRTGEVPGDQPWPESLAESNLTSLWRVELAEGYSGPITSGGKIFTVATRGEQFEVVKAFDLATGDLAWETEWEGSMKVPPFASKNGSWVRSTPLAIDGAFFVGGMRDVLVRFDAETGDETWRVDFTQREGTEVPSFGQVCSPLYDNGHLYLQAGLAVAKLNAGTGETVWRALEDRRAMFGSAFSSPVIGTVAGKRQLIVQTRMSLAGVDLETGDELWSIPVKSFRGMNILTPTVVDENRIFTASYGGGSFLYSVEQDDAGKFSISTLWNDEKIEGYMGSPILVDDHVYLHGRDKRFHCLALEDGKVAWSTKEKFGDYWSMIENQGRILALDQNGELLLIDASPEEFKVIDRRKVSPKDPTWAHLGMEGDKLLIRSLKGLEVFEWK